MELPKDPHMLMSLINMKLRDQYPDLDDLCQSLDLNQGELKKILSDAGYTYNPEANRFI